VKASPGDIVIKNIFVEGPYQGVRLLILAAISLTLAVLDTRYEIFASVKDVASSAFGPVYWTVNAPSRVIEWSRESLQSGEDLAQENEELRTRLLVLETKLLKMASLTAEVNRLKDLLNASSIVDDSVVVAEIIGVNPDPYLHEIVINKGAALGVYVGQPVLDSGGLMGQITHVQADRSHALLISDSNHAVPVQVVRNGVRGVLVGSGVLDQLVLVNMPGTADVREGDTLVSSGLGGRFPAGYPVAEVTRVSHDPGEPFAEIVAVPLAALNESRHVLLVYRRQNVDETVTAGGAGPLP